MKQDDKFLKTIKELIRNLVVSLIAVVLLTQFVLQPVRVDGSSMYPTLVDKEIGFSNILSYKLSDVSRFDVVVIDMAEGSVKKIVKRVIGLPGDTIEVKNDVLFINNVEVQQPFLETDYVREYKANNGKFTEDFGPIVVPKDNYFVMGDNRPRSSDSRDRGSFHHDKIQSKSVIVFLPLNKIRIVGN